MASVVLTFAGSDRPGLVNLIAETIASAGGSWLESRLAQLAGEFAGIIRIEVAESQRHRLRAALEELQTHGLSVTVTLASTPPIQETSTLTLDVVGHDRPGIVRDVTNLLARLGANIEEFTSQIESAPFTGEDLFRASLTLALPAHVTPDEIRRALEALADEIMVDIRTESEATT